MERVAGKVKIVRLDGEDGLVALQKQTAVLSAAYEGHGISARIMDENMAFPQAEPAAATLEDAYVYCMGGKAYGQRLINPSV